MSETKKPKKIAYVRQGRSILTKLGCAQAGATVTPDMISAGTPESQLTIWYRQIRDESGVLELPKKLKTVLSENTEGQLSLETLFGDEPLEDEPAGKLSEDKLPAEDEESRPLENKPPAGKSPEAKPPPLPAEDEESRPRGAKRKK